MTYRPGGDDWFRRMRMQEAGEPQHAPLPGKPLGGKAYGSIPHLPGSKFGDRRDRGVPAGEDLLYLKRPHPGDRIVVQEKLDGCLWYRTNIRTSEGLIEIGKVVNNKLSVLVATWNEETKLEEYKPIEAYHKFPLSHPWVRVVYQSRQHGPPKRSITCTSNHLFFTENGLIPASELQGEMVILHHADKITKVVEQVILGTLLGDGSIPKPRPRNRPSLVMGHGEKQWDYLDLKRRLIGRGGTEYWGKGGYEGSGRTKRIAIPTSTGVSNLIQTLCLRDGKRHITPEWVAALDPLALAIWYMDDGSCTFPKTQRPRAHIAANRYPEDEAALLVKCLRDRFGIECGLFDYKGPTIVLSADGTERFHSIIAPYIHRDLKYKVLPEYRALPCVLETYADSQAAIPTEVVPTKVLEVKKDVVVPKQSLYQYDLTIKDNHNYFANDILVHNSNVAVCSLNSEILPLVRNGYPAAGSVWRQHRLFARWVRARADTFAACLGDGDRVVGEWLAQAHGTRYDLTGREPFVVFDYFRGDRRLPAIEAEARVRAHGLAFVPVLAAGPEGVPVADALLLLGEHGHYGAIDPAEGVVYRRETPDGMVYLAKYVRPEAEPGRYFPGDDDPDKAVWNWPPGGP
jgi:hypothetical protein